jgi:hypothetical protein
MTMPKWTLPNSESYGGNMVVDLELSSYVDLIQDSYGTEIAHLTGATVYDNKLYLGSLRNDFVGVHDLL